METWKLQWVQNNLILTKYFRVDLPFKTCTQMLKKKRRVYPKTEMHAQASSSTNLVSESSSDDEDYLQQVPAEKMRVVKCYKRIKSQLKAIKRKKKMILVQEKVIKEEKMLLKSLLFSSLDTKSKGSVKGRKIAKGNLKSSRNTSFSTIEDTNLLIQIQKEELSGTSTSSLEHMNPINKTQIPNESSYKYDKNEVNNKEVKTDENIAGQIYVPQENKAAYNSDKHVTEQNINLSNKAQEKEGNINEPIFKRHRTLPKPKGKVIYKMVDVTNGYYINITRPICKQIRYMILMTRLFKCLKPIMKEFSDFICPELFSYIIRNILEKRINELLLGKEELKTKVVLKMYREKYPEDRDGYFIISTLVAIWRGDFNDPFEPGDPHNNLIKQRHPEKLVSYEDIACGSGTWNVQHIESEKVRTTESVRSKNDLDQTATEMEDKKGQLQCNMDSSFEIVDGDEVTRNCTDTQKYKSAN